MRIIIQQMKRNRDPLQHVYLLTASLVLTVLILTEDRPYFKIGYFVTLAAHAYLLIKWRSFYNLKMFVLGDNPCEQIYQIKKEQREAAIKIKQKLNISANINKDNNQSKSLYHKVSFEDIPRLQDKGNFVPLNQIFEKIQSKPKWDADTQDRSSSLDYSQLSFSLSQRNQIKRQLKSLQEGFESTLKTYRISEQSHTLGVEQAKKIVSRAALTVVQKHEQNLFNINELLKNHFNVALDQYTQIVMKASGSVTLNELLSEYDTIHRFSKLPWDFPPLFPAISRTKVINSLLELLQERMMLDKYCKTKQRNDNKRMLIMSRLKTLVFEYNHEMVAASTSNETAQLQQLSDQLLIYNFLEVQVNKDLHRQTQNYFKIKRVNESVYLNNKHPKELCFVYCHKDSGIVHFNFKGQERYYQCQNGENNVFSAIYFYTLELFKYGHTELYKDVKLLNELVNKVR